jgi:YD repeat-containing protein
MYDANGNIVETIDAAGNSSYFEYDAMNRLIKVSLYRIDALHNVNEEQITLYEYDKRGLVTKEISAAEDETIYLYDGNGNLVQKTDADGYVTEFSYDPRNLVEQINYSGGKEAQFAYNKNGELIAMMDWNGTVNFALDLLGQITSVNDQNEMITSYVYDEVGNRTSITYPDSTTADYTFDL